MREMNDLRIVSHLRENSRMSLTQLSKSTGIPVSTIFERMKRNANNIIRKNTCLIDFSKVGMNTRAKIALKVSPDERVLVREFLEKNKNVNSLYKINNGYDYMLDVVFKNMKELEDFLELVDDKFKIKSKHVFYVIEEITQEKFLSNSMIPIIYT